MCPDKNIQSHRVILEKHLGRGGVLGLFWISVGGIGDLGLWTADCGAGANTKQFQM